MTMKKLLTGLLTFTLALGAIAEVPSLINYQGHLKDNNGTNINGTKNFTVRIYDAKTEGTLIYEENIDGVEVSEGSYSFSFGANGASKTGRGSKIVAHYRSSDNPRTYQFTPDDKNIINLKIEAYVPGVALRWSDGVSSDPAKFVVVPQDSGLITVIFPQFIVGQGPITVEYDLKGITYALLLEGQKWLELTVEGVTLSPRERLVAVPYALRAAVAAVSEEDVILEIKGYKPQWSGVISPSPDAGYYGHKKHYFSKSKNKKNLKFVASFYPQPWRNQGGDVRMYVKLMKRENGEEDYKLVAEKYSPVYSGNQFQYEQSVELTNITETGFCRIEFGIENVSDRDTLLAILDYVLLLRN